MNPLATIHKDLEQGSEAWLAARIGRATASQASRIITAVKGEYSKAATAYALELIAERMAPTEPPPFAGNAAMDRGNLFESVAREAFHKHTSLITETVGFISVRLTDTSDFEPVGLSPDGLITDTSGQYIAGLECKCPLRTKHVLNHVANGLPDDYKQQIHWSLALTQLPAWHFFSWHPDMQPVHHITYADDYTEKVRAAIEQFVIEYGTLCEQLIPKLQLNPPALF